MQRILLVLLSVWLVPAVCQAQTFAPTVTGSSAVAASSNAPKFAPDKPVKQAKPAQNGKTAEKKKPAENLKEPPAEVADRADAEQPRKVIKNFEGRKDEKKYDNSSRKVFHFKMVDGKLQMDDDDNRSILVFYDNYQIQKGMDGLVRCTVRLYVLNDLQTRISSLGLKIRWPEISAAIQMDQVNPGVKTYKDIMLLGNGCYSMDKVPVIEVNRCRVKGMSQQACADAVRWYQGVK
jgi:hypothetical protein